MAQQRTLAASAAAHDDEDVAAPDHEVEIAHQNETAISHRQVSHDDVRLRIGAIVGTIAGTILAVGDCRHAEAQIPRKLKTTANSPQATTIMTSAMTTACVAASPTAEELLPH